MRAGTHKPPSSPTRTTADPDDRTCRQPTEYWGSSLVRFQIAKEEGGWLWHGQHYVLRHGWSVHPNCPQRYWKRVWAPCRQSKGSLWTEAQLKRINKSCQDVRGHDQECVRAEQNHTLAEDCNSFEMQKMAIRTNQLLCITVANGSRVHTSELESETHGRAKTQVLSLKQYHAHYYQFYEKGTTRAMVGLKGLLMCDAFWHSNVSTSVGLKSFCPCCFRLGGNVGMIATHLREVP